MNLLERLTSLFAPDECLSCGREGSLLCTRCRELLMPPKGVCFGCRSKVIGVACSRCLASVGCDSLTAIADYRGLAKQLVASLKFMGNQSAARLMADSLHSLTGILPRALITHVPATTQHIRQRGYDQSALIGKQLARRTGLEHVTLLARLGKKHQLGAGRQERLMQLRDGLRVRLPASVAGRCILLVDDVLTTGASVTAAAAVLRAAGAASVDVLVFAQALPASSPAGMDK